MSCEEIRVVAVKFGQDFNLYFADEEGCGVHFTIHYYKDNRLEDGMSVAFSVLVENKTYCMYCTHEGGEKTVRFREEVVPKEILENSSDIIFIQKSVSPTDTKSIQI